MTLFFVIWSALIAAVWLASRGADKTCLGYMLLTILAVQPAKLIGLGDTLWIVFAFSWIAAGGAIQRQVGTKNTRQIAACALTLTSAMCYAWGKFGGYPFAPGSPPLVAADVFGLSAVLSLGGPGVVRIVRTSVDGVRGSLVGRNTGRRGAYPVRSGMEGAK